MTNTDRLNACQTWEEVVDCPLYDDWVKFVYASETWLDSFAAQDNSYDEESAQRYEDLCDLADETLTKQENLVLFHIVEQGKSLRVVGAELGVSHETVRNLYSRACKKMRDAIAQEQ
jgi:RNA polymerase sigma factor (sigma-70 family)